MNYKIFWTIFSSYLLAFAIFAYAHNYETPKDKISICCKTPEKSLGWTNTLHKYTYPNINPFKVDNLISTAQECCQACVEHQDCVQWDFGQNTCLLVGNGLLGQELSADPVKTCDLVTGPPTRGTDAGIIRCSDGCIPKLRKYWKHHDKN
ncbi:hypothetical protein F8M41_000872 [Gigaspora margarita]|uniref:Apple domain-containing protein n=1 Tax=Gigaspora margarita TaxID=4874 RepID=A0A8H4AZC9_GIGMA|nr:hypothetical protein F8M41_000872 [Gigaspora margarita]